MTRDNQFSPEVYVLANTLRSHCVDQHLVVRQLRGVSQTSSTRLATTRTYPQVRYLNDTSNLLELPLALRRRRHKTPQNHRETATNNHQLVPMLLRCSKPSRWWQPPRATNESRSETRIPSASRCNHSSNALGFSPNLTKMMNQ